MRRLPCSIFVALWMCFGMVACAETSPDDDDTEPSPDDDDTAPGDDDTAPGDDDSATDDDDTTADDDDSTAADDDDSQAAAPAPPGQTLCAAGGRVSGEGISGVICLSPLDMAAGRTATSADGSLVWHPGPIRRIAP